MNTKEAKKLLRKAKDNARLGNGGGKLVTSLRKQGLSEDEIGIRVGRKTCTITLEDVKNAIENLPDKYQYVLMLYLIEGYDHQEISEILNISEIASRTQLSRGKIKLQELLTLKKDGTRY